VGFDDLDVTYDGERTFAFTCVRGENKKQWSFRVPAMIYRGVWREGDYQAGDTATTAGSLWVALVDTKEKPGTSKDWQLCVKKGNDGGRGADGKEGPKGPKGDKGDRGPDRW
jgi:hypothetical protein